MQILEKQSSVKEILIVLTSHDKLGNTGNKTGFWYEEFATPFYALKDKGINITLTSPEGGRPPIDPTSLLTDYQTISTKRIDADKEAQAILSNTLKLDSINEADYDAVFFPGGHGPLWDLAENKDSIALIEAFYHNNKSIAAVCHAPAIFKHAKNTDGTPLVKGKKVTGYSNAEEEAIQLTSVVPFSVEDMLKKNGGIYSKEENFVPYAVEDGLLITGQNPASAELVVELMLKGLN